MMPLVEILKDRDLSQVELERVAAILPVSRAIGSSLLAHPELAAGELDTSKSLPLQQAQALLQIAGDEITGRIDLPGATDRYSKFIDGVVERSLAAARGDIESRHPLAPEIPFAVIAMGKWGADELNYSSDIDMIFVHGHASDDQAANRATALALASRLVGLLSSTSFDGSGFVIDTDLRPEGSMGPLSRQLSAYQNYYDRWAEPWELQALLKARAAAGDDELGLSFEALATKVIWDEGLDVDALRGLRRIKIQTEQNSNPADLKRAPGGIRDIEFTVQMLQLVHGRHDARLRVRGTVNALQALDDGEYITSEERDELSEAYLFLRRLEHLVQIWDLRQTHRFPSDEPSRLRLAQAMGHSDIESLLARLKQTRSAARTLHERIYFRPVLDSLVGSPSARLGPDRAGERLTALGFGNPEQARKALGQLTKGLSRRSRAMQQMLPLMLDWLSLSPDPDLGLSQLRLLLSNTRDHSSMVARLLNNPVTGERLAMLLGTGKLLGSLIDRIPEFVPRLDSDTALSKIRNRRESEERLEALLASRPNLEDQIGTIRRFARRMRLRIAARDVLMHHDTVETTQALSDTAEAAMAVALRVATSQTDPEFIVVAMGRWGGEELSYGSDLDVTYVYDRMERADALALPTALTEILSSPGRHGEGYDLDATLRPEGKGGPMARSLESTERYFKEWSEPWEHLALTRARPIAGNETTMQRFTEMKEEILWGSPVSHATLASIRRIKARVENERIRPDEDPDFHLKLGPGSLSDIEFLTQLLQLKHGHDRPELRMQGTIPTLQALLEAGIISPTDHLALVDSYEFCTRVRLRLHLQQGKQADSLPTDPDEMSKIAASLGYDRSLELREIYRRVTRRARRVFLAHFFE